MRKLVILLAVGLALGGVARAQAQNVNASITIPQVLAIDVSNSSIVFPDAQAGDYDATGTALVPAGAANNSVIGTRGNVVHAVEIEALTGQFAFDPGSWGQTDPGKLVSDLEWSADAGGTWAGLTSGAAARVVSTLGRGVNASAATVQYRMRSTLAGDVPGIYSVTFVYTVVPD